MFNKRLVELIFSECRDHNLLFTQIRKIDRPNEFLLSFKKKKNQLIYERRVGNNGESIRLDPIYYLFAGKPKSFQKNQTVDADRILTAIVIGSRIRRLNDELRPF